MLPCKVVHLQLQIRTILMLALIVYSGYGAIEPPQFSAMFVFGDSLVDAGNNNFLNSMAKANYWPYGIDFSGGSTGRFSNGKTIVDFLGDLVGLPPLPAYTEPFKSGRDYSKGVNHASAAAGILDESGRSLVQSIPYYSLLLGGDIGDRFPLRQQVQNFRNTLSQLRNQMDEKEMRQYLASSLVSMNIGSNDYINNYLLSSLGYTTRYTYNPQDYATLLIRNYTTHILDLRGLGLRKFLLAAIGPLGCIPNQIASGLAPPGKCVTYVNDIVQIFNMKLRSLVDQLNSNYNDSTFVYGNTYGAFREILDNPTSYGFSITDTGCCGLGKNRGQITCLPLEIPCSKRDQYIFWDPYHPTQAVNKIIAQNAYAGPPADCYPVNVKQLARLSLH